MGNSLLSTLKKAGSFLSGAATVVTLNEYLTKVTDSNKEQELKSVKDLFINSAKTLQNLESVNIKDQNKIVELESNILEVQGKVSELEKISAKLNKINPENRFSSTDSEYMVKEILKGTGDVNKQLQSIIDKFNGKTQYNNNYFFELLESYKEFISNLNFIELGALSHIVSSLFILFCIINIISIIYGDFIIKYLKIENRFPRIAKYIEMRRKFQYYYLFINLLLIIITLLALIYINYLVFIKY